MSPRTFAGRIGRPPIRVQTLRTQNPCCFYLHHHGRNGSKTDWHNLGPTSPAPVRQPAFPCHDSLTEPSTGDFNSSRPIGRHCPAENGCCPSTTGSESNQICSYPGSRSQ